MIQAIEAHPWYNRCKENRGNPIKTLHLEDGYVSIQQWADQSGRFQTASRHESERKQPLGKESPNDPLDGN